MPPDHTELGPEEKQLVAQHFPTWPLNDLVWLPGRVAMPRTILPLLPRIRDLPLRPDDIWVLSFPKCGTTWTQEMVWMVANGLDMVDAQRPLVIRSPFLELGCILPSAAKPPAAELPAAELPAILTGADHPGQVAALVDEMARDPIGFVTRLPGRRVIKSHLPLHLLPPGLLSTCRCVLVTRGIKDCAVSYFHHNQDISPHDYVGDFTQFADLFRRGLVYNGGYWAHRRSFARADGPRLLRISFEDMKADQHGTIRALCSFLGTRLAEEQVDRLAAHLAFPSMRANPAVNPFAASARPGGMRGHFVRSGKVGGWVDHFPPALAEEWGRWEEEELEREKMEQQEKGEEKIV